MSVCLRVSHVQRVIQSKYVHTNYTRPMNLPFCDTCRREQESNVPRDLRGTFAGVNHLGRENTREHLMAAGTFHEHRAYTLFSETNPETGRLTVVISTENLLLNAYRQSVCGLPSQISLDASHRVVLGNQPTVAVCSIALYMLGCLLVHIVGQRAIRLCFLAPQGWIISSISLPL